MIRVDIQIGNGKVEDSYDKWGFIYLSSDNRFEAPLKAFDKISYPEDAGEIVDARTVPDAFDYVVKFLVETPNNDYNNANEKIAEFNRALWSYGLYQDMRQYQQITIYNPYKRVKIVGIPEPIAEIKDFYRNRTDCAVFELKIRVNDPTLCNFNY